MKNNENFINDLFLKYDNKTFGFLVCENCFCQNNLIICSTCKNYFHLQVQ